MRTTIFIALWVLCPLGAAVAAKGTAKTTAPRADKKAPAPEVAPTEGDEQGGEEEDGADQAEAGETTGSEVSEPPVKVVKPPDVEGARETAPGEVHTVVKGDTLWDLSQKYLGSPWYWPKVWSYNPEIANPHWIYPGNIVRFFPGGEEVPARVEVGGAGEEVAGGAGEGDEDLSSASMIAGETEPVAVVGKIGYAHKKALRYTTQGFVTRQEVEETGVIAASFSEAHMLSYPDTVYVKFKKKKDVRVGDRYVIFRTGGKVIHPETGKEYGYITHLLGFLKVIKLTDKAVVTAQIGDTFDEILRGDLVGPAGENLTESIAVNPNAKDLRGYVIGTLNPSLTIYGEHHVIVLDRGSKDGVATGNTFDVVRQSDLGGNFYYPAFNQDTSLPIEVVASCMVVNVKDRASLCLITRSIREVVWGDHVEMHVARPGATASAQ